MLVGPKKNPVEILTPEDIAKLPQQEQHKWEIAAELGFKVPTMPVWFVKCLAKFGDFLGLFHIHFPMQSFRFGNMTNDGINDMSNTYKIAPEMPYTRLEGTKETIAWINKYEKRKEK